MPNEIELMTPKKSTTTSETTQKCSKTTSNSMNCIPTEKLQKLPNIKQDYKLAKTKTDVNLDDIDAELSWLTSEISLNSSNSMEFSKNLKSSPSFLKNDFINKFVSIKTKKQRRAYKIEFSKDYSRYTILHAEVEQISKHISHLQQKLNNIPEKSPEHFMLQKIVFAPYLKSA